MRRPRRRPQSERPRLDELPPLEQHAKKDFSKPLISELAFWLPENTDWELIEALYALDRCNDKEPLIGLLRRRGGGNVFLADLLERYTLRRKPGRYQRTPAYDKTPIEQRIAGAMMAVRKHGRSPAAAARYWGLDPDQLADALAGKRLSTRRMQARLRPLGRHRP